MKKLIAIVAAISLTACGTSNTIKPEYVAVAIQLCAQFNMPLTETTVDIDVQRTGEIITARCGEDLTIKLRIQSKSTDKQDWL